MSRQVDLGQIIPNIQVGTTTTGLPSSQASVVNVGTDLNPILNFTIPKGEPGAIQMIIVNELPQTGQENTIYLVPLAIPESQENRYAEYVYINGNWELLGKIGIQVDLTDYYTKQETNNLLDNKQNKITQTNKLDYSLIDNAPTIPSKTSDLTNDSDFTTKTYVDGLIGDIGTALDTINGESV